MKILFALALALPTIFLDPRNCNAVKVNGQEVSNDFSYESNGSNIVFKIQDGAIQVGETELDESQLSKIASSSTSLKGQLGKINSRATLRFSGHVGEQHFSAPQIIFEDQSGITIDTCILDTQDLSFNGDHIELSSCFVNSACSVVLKPYDSSHSIVKELKFFPKASSEAYKLFMQGDIDLANNATREMLIVVGANKVDIKLK